MKASKECIPCILDFCRRTLDYCVKDESLKERILKRLDEEFVGISLDSSPAFIADYATRIIKKEVGIEDLYSREKGEQNQKALRIYPQLKGMVDQSDDRLRTAFLISAIGNVIDLGAHADFNVDEIIRDFKDIDFTKDDYEKFRKELDSSRTLLFVVDNCGEVVFDRVLLEEIDSVKKIVAVKSKPFINDVTINDIEGLELDTIAEVIETGTCNLDFSSSDIRPEFVEVFDGSDIVISKGHANFEALHGRRPDIYFLLRAKCDVVAREIGVEKGSFLFCNIP
jgi:uncharacterized protein with ATP-grasp and redox domains